MPEEPTYEELVGEEVAADEALEAGLKLKAHDLFNRLRASFPEPQFITLEEVRDATGFDGVRTADAMAISLYRSRGKAVYGFEMKVSRADWLKELKQPEKAESILRYCDYWALVVSDKDIVKPGELPSTWGMYVAQKNRLKCVVPCPKLDPIPMDRTMLTALLYAVKQKQAKIDSAALFAAKNEGYKEGVSRSKDAHFEKSYNELDERIRTFEKSSGLSIRYGYEGTEKIGEAVHTLLHADEEIKALLSKVKYSIKSSERLTKELQEHAGILEKVMITKSEEKEELE